MTDEPAREAALPQAEALCEVLAQALYEQEGGEAGRPWDAPDGGGAEAGRRGRCRARAAALVAGPLAAVLAENRRAAEQLVTLRRERDRAREAESFWQRWGFDADELATRRLGEEMERRLAAERGLVVERTARERLEGVVRLFATLAAEMPPEGWLSEWIASGRDIPLWWFQAARLAGRRVEAHDAPPTPGSE